MQGSIRNTFLFFLLLFLLLLVWLTYIQVWAAPGLNRNPRNTRALEQQMRIERGDMLIPGMGWPAWRQPTIPSYRGRQTLPSWTTSWAPCWGERKAALTWY